MVQSIITYGVKGGENRGLHKISRLIPAENKWNKRMPEGRRVFRNILWNKSLHLLYMSPNVFIARDNQEGWINGGQNLNGPSIQCLAFFHTCLEFEMMKVRFYFA